MSQAWRGIFVIVVTPYLVKPSLARLATPVDGFNLPHDMQRIRRHKGQNLVEKDDA